MVKAVDIVDWDGEGNVIDFLVEVIIPEPVEDNFLKIKETLTRIGIASKVEKNVLYQSCHILQKRGKYYIVSFKTLFVLDGRNNTLTTGDIARQNRIALLLEDWGLLKIKDRSIIGDTVSGLGNTMIIPFAKKKDWDLRVKYLIGRK